MRVDEVSLLVVSLLGREEPDEVLLPSVYYA